MTMRDVTHFLRWQVYSVADAPIAFVIGVGICHQFSCLSSFPWVSAVVEQSGNPFFLSEQGTLGWHTACNYCGRNLGINRLSTRFS